jgi:dihydroorotase
MSSLLIKNATLINEGKSYLSDVLIRNDEIEKIASEINLPDKNTELIDAEGLILIPGVIDDQVHFREPGLTHKADLFTESRAAAAGGVTSFMEMPNTIPQSTNIEELERKYELAAEKSLVNYTFYLGATNNNLDQIKKIDPTKICGVKVFMGSSTGDMLVDNKKTLEGIFAESPTLIATHCEDETSIIANTEKYKLECGDDIPFSYHPIIRSAEACYKSSSLAVELATKYGSQLHILHLSSAKELSLFEANSNVLDKKITAEVCVHHLWFNSNDYEKFGSRIKWNPAIKTAFDQEQLWNGLLNNKLDVIATDHAPHTIEEKNNKYFKAPSGGPLVQHSLVAMLEFYHQGKISLETIVKKMCHAPADLYRVTGRGYIREGYKADLVLINLNSPWIVSKSNLLYKCGWSPFEGVNFRSEVVQTFVNGKSVYKNGSVGAGSGERLIFNR